MVGVFVRVGTDKRWPWMGYVVCENGCWEWVGSTSDGYGRIGLGGKKVLAHRFMYEAANGIIPVGREIDHLCRNKACVNPDHMEPVTHRENLLRGTCPAAVQARSETCRLGHKYSTVKRVGRPDGRRCLVCMREQKRLRRTHDTTQP